MVYKPGDNWTFCDLSGKKIYQSTVRRTWDGLLVDPEWWDPRHPQLDVRGVPDDMSVPEARPRQADVFVSPAYGTGSIILQSANGSLFQVGVSDEGEITVMPAPWQFGVPVIVIDSYLLSVTDDGILFTSAASTTGVGAWIMISSSGGRFNLSINSLGGLVLETA